MMLSGMTWEKCQIFVPSPMMAPINDGGRVIKVAEVLK